MGWSDSLRKEILAGRYRRVSEAVPDPGNPGQVIALFVTPTRGKVLVAVNGTRGPNGEEQMVSISVPPHFTDPLAAAAWLCDDPDHPVRCPPWLYAELRRRT